MSKKKLTDEMIHKIKSAPQDKTRVTIVKEIEEEFGIVIGRTTIYDVQIGKSHKDKYPELTRKPRYRQVHSDENHFTRVETVAEGTPVLDMSKEDQKEQEESAFENENVEDDQEDEAV